MMKFALALPLIFAANGNPIVPPGYFLEPPGLAMPRDCELLAQLPNILPVVGEGRADRDCDDPPDVGLKAN